MEEFKNRLKEALEKREMRPVDLSERTGISRSVISSYLAGRWKAKQDNLYLISKAMNIDPAWLMGYDISMDGTPIKKHKESLTPSGIMKVGELIQKYREEAGLSVQDLADAIGKDRSTIYRYENGEIEKLPSDLLVPVANVLGVSPAQLIVSENNDDAPDNKLVGSRIKEIRKLRKMTLRELGDHIGLSESNTKRYEDGQIKTVGIDLIKKIAAALDVPESYLTGWEDIPPYKKLDNYVPITKKKIPLLGEIAAGQPIYADGHIEEYLPVNDDLRVDFALKIKGDSMINANIDDGDIVFIRQQSDVDDGQIAAVLIDDSATLKRVYHMQDFIQLQAENPKYPPMIFSNKNCDDVRILGLAVAVLGKIK